MNAKLVAWKIQPKTCRFEFAIDEEIHQALLELFDPNLAITARHNGLILLLSQLTAPSDDDFERVAQIIRRVGERRKESP